MFESQLVKTDTTAAKLFVDHILAGNGNYLYIFDKNNAFQQKIKIFDGDNIQGVDIDERKILIYGSCKIQILEYFENPFTVKKTLKSNLNDWILASTCFKKCYAFVVMNNKLIICNENLDSVQKIECSVKCILYSAFLTYDEQKDELTVFSGTVFGKIIVWKIENQEKCLVLNQVEGHNGAIFSIHKNENFICSSSDDRSTILWSICENDLSQITLFRKFYGHQSRVFRCKLLENKLITGGEDGVINVWNFAGDLIRKIETHGAVWALECDNQRVIAGGKATDLTISQIEFSSHHDILNFEQNPKKLVILFSGNFAVLTENGDFYYVVKSNKWVKIGTGDSILEVSHCRKLVALSANNTISIFKETTDGLKLWTCYKLEVKSRICSFHWLTCESFLICQTDGLLTLFYEYKKTLKILTHFQLPQQKDLFSTTACLYEKFCIIGDRRGNIYVYEITEKIPIFVYKKAHSHLGITKIQNVKNKITSFGRDGTIKSFVITEKKLQLVFSDKLPFSWLTSLHDDVICAFSGRNFVIWDYKNRKTISEFGCGGGHRSWDFYKKDFFNFAYIKDKNVNVVQIEDKRSLNLLSDFHTNTTNSLEIVDDSFLVLSGSEDTTLRLSKFSQNNFFNVGLIKAHLSSIRTICVEKISETESIVFSGGGRGQIVCWKLENSNIFQLYSHYEKGTEKLSESEIRIMDLKVSRQNNEMFLFSACSDGNINVFKVENFSLSLIKKIFVENKCVSKIVVLDSKYTLLSASTDGFLNFWDINQISEIKNFGKIKIHQSGVLSLSHYFITDELCLIVSGGDDNCIIANLIKFEQKETLSFTCLFTFRDLSHCAQVTGIHISDGYFLTTSIDQKLLVFEWKFSNNSLGCKLLDKYETVVPDIQGTACKSGEGCFHVFLYGKGVEYVKIKIK